MEVFAYNISYTQACITIYVSFALIHYKGYFYSGDQLNFNVHFQSP
jgi:hypothetical protein